MVLEFVVFKRGLLSKVLVVLVASMVLVVSSVKNEQPLPKQPPVSTPTCDRKYGGSLRSLSSKKRFDNPDFLQGPSEKCASLPDCAFGVKFAEFWENLNGGL